MYNYNDYLLNDYFMNNNTTPNVLNNQNGLNDINSMPNINSEMQPDLYTPEEGYNKGNLFRNLYDGYKNYKPRELKANNEQERMFLDLSRYLFAFHELKLYLDVNPDDESMVRLLNDYKTRAIKMMREYEEKYGPITELSEAGTTSFTWEDKDWPWEGGIK